VKGPTLQLWSDVRVPRRQLATSAQARHQPFNLLQRGPKKPGFQNRNVRHNGVLGTSCMTRCCMAAANRAAAEAQRQRAEICAGPELHRELSRRRTRPRESFLTRVPLPNVGPGGESELARQRLSLSWTAPRRGRGRPAPGLWPGGELRRVGAASARPCIRGSSELPSRELAYQCVSTSGCRGGIRRGALELIDAAAATTSVRQPGDTAAVRWPTARA
jgi:hypothetical protein